MLTYEDTRFHELVGKKHCIVNEMNGRINLVFATRAYKAADNQFTLAFTAVAMQQAKSTVIARRIGRGGAVHVETTLKIQPEVAKAIILQELHQVGFTVPGDKLQVSIRTDNIERVYRKRIPSLCPETDLARDRSLAPKKKLKLEAEKATMDNLTIDAMQQYVKGKL